MTSNAPSSTTKAGLQKELDTLLQTHAEYRARVRDRALKGYKDGQWSSLDLLNQTLETLGLDLYHPKRVTRGTLSLRLPLVADTDDRGYGLTAMAQLETLEVRDALRRAIAQVLATYTTDAPTVLIDDGEVDVQLGSVTTVEL